MTSTSPTPLDQFRQKLREAVTELHDTGGHYLLSEEQLAQVEAAARELVEQTIKDIGVSLDSLSGEYGVPYLNGGMSPTLVKAVRMDFVEESRRHKR